MFQLLKCNVLGDYYISKDQENGKTIITGNRFHDSGDFLNLKAIKKISQKEYDYLFNLFNKISEIKNNLNKLKDDLEFKEWDLYTEIKSIIDNGEIK